ncbi:unnamed protein product [Cuscuta epithymum]|uniref:Protein DETOXIFICATION n=1 Tax=Cuscuta epithymum TaxID=186058 RepID=A0AAV0G8U7_9ASTE|nr:unnamed protein product [Cuscuta epithymum]
MKSPLVSSETKKEDQQTHLSLAAKEAKCLSNIAFPMIFTALLLYSRSMISMLFLGRLGDLSLAGGSLAIGFANITGYSILSGLAMGMEPICGQAFGAKRFKLIGLTLQRTIILLLLASIPIAFLWCNMEKVLILCGQDRDISKEAQSYILYSLPDLVALSFLHPLRIYLRSQSVTVPLTYCAAFATLIHAPINYVLVSVLGLGIRGVALGSVWCNFNLVGSLIAYVAVSGIYKKHYTKGGNDCTTLMKGYKSLLNLAVPSCISVCLEWWWYEMMTLFCGLLVNPRITVASMGILIQTTSLIYIFPSSLSFGVSTRVGNELGAGRPERARLAAVLGLCGSFLCGIAALTFGVFVRNIWGGIFTEDPEIIALTASVLPIIGLCELGNCPQTTGCGALRGTARPKLAANINLGCFYLVGMPVAVWLGFFAGFDFQGLWIGLLAAQVSCALTMLLVLGRTDWEEQARSAKELTAAISVNDHGGDDDDGKDSPEYQKIGSSPI